MSKKLRINNKIRAEEVLVIDDNKKLGVINIKKALQIAQEKGLDLVEVAPIAKPPVCKFMDYGTYLYGLKKKEQKAKKAVKKTETKTIRLSIRTEKHDLEVKAKKARKFLENKNMVKVALIFRGREMAHKDLGEEKMKIFYESIEDICTMEEKPKRQGFQMIMILTPNK